MTTIARRKFLGQAAAIASSPIWYKSIFADAQTTTLVRYNVLSPQGQAMIAKYARAVQIMKTKPASDPCSWIFQWYTHAIPVSKAMAIQQTFGSSPSPARTLAEQAWWTCQPHQSGQNTDNFLPWHRMFVYFFEKMIRATINDPTFTLPYWNYSPGLPTNSQSGIMPSNFRASSNPAFASLYVQNRNPGVNTGSSIDTGNPGLLSAAGALAETTYSPHSPVQGFCSNLNSNLHGNVHGLIGTNSNMGYVPTAGQDPIFWMHHCNIDRLWASWNRAGNLNPTNSAFLNQTFTFAGPDCKGISMAVRDVMEISQLKYTYQEFQPVPPKVRSASPSLFTTLSARAPLAATTLATTANVSLASATTRASLTQTTQVSNKKLFDLSLGAPAPGVGRYYLVVKDLQIKAQPGVIYKLFLDLPTVASEATRHAHLIGYLNFFSAMPGMSMNAEDRFISYDISALVKRLGAASVNGPINLTVSSSQGAASGSEPVIGSVSIVQV
jgi:tyrosinase